MSSQSRPPLFATFVEEHHENVSVLPVAIADLEIGTKRKPRTTTKDSTRREKGVSKSSSKRSTTTGDESAFPERRPSERRKNKTGGTSHNVTSVLSAPDGFDAHKRTKRSKSEVTVKPLKRSNAEHESFSTPEDTTTDSQPEPCPLSLSQVEVVGLGNVPELKRDGPIVTKMDGGQSVIVFAQFDTLLDLAINEDAKGMFFLHVSLIFRRRSPIHSIVHLSVFHHWPQAIRGLDGTA